MSKLKFDVAVPPVPYKYRGITFHLNVNNSFRELEARRSELCTAAGFTPEQYASLPREAREIWQARASVGTMIVGIDSFSMGDGYTFVFDAPSEVEGYATQGEELMGENPSLFDVIVTRVSIEQTQLPDFEIVGNSQPPSVGGGVQTVLPETTSVLNS